ncbi:hypothetical protein ACFSMW_16225 [Virgibacillus halophilus]|uniref:hypothetical protein n=1 Tax=Tigheibacillus halophilus TaxID=361280 RepID=UPI003627C6D7
MDYFLSTGEDPLQPDSKPDSNDQILEKLENLKEQFNQLLLECLEKQNQYISESIKKRDKMLTQTMKEMHQPKFETAAAGEKKVFGVYYLKNDLAVSFYFFCYHRL